MKIMFLILCVLLSSSLTFGQETEKITLDSCLKMAIRHAPESGLIALNQKASQLKMQNIKTNTLPSLNLNGQASYQSDVTQIPNIPFPSFSIEPIGKDWYKLNLDVDQLLYDGGLTAGRKQLEKNNLAMENGKVDIQTYKVKEQVSQLFFTLLTLRDNIRILHLLEKSLTSQIEDAQTAVVGGVLLKADFNALKVEKKLILQKIIEKEEDAKGLLNAMNELTGLKISDLNAIVSPKQKQIDYHFENNRPDFKIISLQQARLQSLKTFASAKRMPLLKAFGQAGYGRPGYDMLNNNFDTYYMVGLRFHWNIWDWNKVKHEKRVLDIQKNILSVQKESMNRNLKAQLQKIIAAIEKYGKLIASDNDIIALQQTVVAKSSAQLENGTITSTNYLIELNKLAKMQLQQKEHQLLLIYAQYQYFTSEGNL